MWRSRYILDLWLRSLEITYVLLPGLELSMLLHCSKTSVWWEIAVRLQIAANSIHLPSYSLSKHIWCLTAAFWSPVVWNVLSRDSALYVLSYCLIMATAYEGDKMQVPVINNSTYILLLFIFRCHSSCHSTLVCKEINYPQLYLLTWTAS